MLDWVDETPTGLDQVSAFSEDGNRAARIRVESFTPDVHKGVILEAMTVHEATGLTPSQLQARVAEMEAALRPALEFVELFSNRWDGQHGRHPFGIVTDARKALGVEE